MTPKKLPLFLKNTQFSLYGNLGERIAAALLDGLFLIPLGVGMLVFNSLHLYNYFYTIAVTQLITVGYHIYLPVRYGATPGKRIMGLTILKEDGSAITYKESFLKYLPLLFVGLFAFIVQSMALVKADPAVFDGLGWMAQTKYLQSFYTIPLWIQTAIIYSYYIGTIVMVAINDRHRSVGDAVAGTVVVYTRCLEKIAEYMEEGEEE